MDFLNGELQEKDEYFGVLNPKGWVLGWLTGGMSNPNFGLIPCWGSDPGTVSQKGLSSRLSFPPSVSEDVGQCQGIAHMRSHARNHARVTSKNETVKRTANYWWSGLEHIHNFFASVLLNSSYTLPCQWNQLWFIFTGAREAFIDKTLLYREKAVKRKVYVLSSPSYGLILTSPQTAFTLAHQRKELAKMTLPAEAEVQSLCRPM